MKIHNLGSINIDFVYSLSHFVTPGETIACDVLRKFAGGKGFNQSTALTRAGAMVAHIGAVGADGVWLAEALARDGADVSRIAVLDDGTPSGHAIIQVNPQGQNCIIIASGANGAINEAMVDAALANAEADDFFLAQNETTAVAYAMRAAKARGLRVALNPAPMNERALALPLDLVDVMIVNEIEGAALAENREMAERERERAKEGAITPSLRACIHAKQTSQGNAGNRRCAGTAGIAAKEHKENTGEEYAAIFDALRKRFPNATIVLTLGKDGVIAAEPDGVVFSHGVYPVKVVDSTAAGDCFTGFLLAEISSGASLADALKTASVASSISVSRAGASPSIPTMEEVKNFMPMY